MVRHIVLFQLSKTLDISQKFTYFNQFKSALLHLAEKVDYVKRIDIGLNANPSESYDIALIADFATFDDLQSYSQHPEHVAAASALRQHVSSRSCVDYQY